MHLGRAIGLAATVMVMAAPLQECDFGEPQPPADGPCTTVPTTDDSLIPNGDFNFGYVDENDPGAPGPYPLIGRSVAPWAWTATPDYSTDERIMFNGYDPERTDLPGFDSSPVGGSFMGFRSYTRQHEEGIMNTIQVDDPNREMTVFFYYTEYTQVIGRLTAPPPNEPTVNIQLRFGVTNGFFPENTGELIANVENLSVTGGVQGTWEERRITFTPADLGFGQPGNYRFLLGAKDGARDTWSFVDGLTVVFTDEICEPPEPTTTTVPEPTTTTTFPEPTTTTFVEPTTSTIIGN
jgi:hypothetical protein